jgi:putative phosphoribosyl transferase
VNRIHVHPAPHPYADRAEAGQRLAAALTADHRQDALVLGIPRGGVPVAAAVATAIGGELDVVVARKLGAPHQPELAIGAVTANGGLYLDEEAVFGLGVSQEYLTAEIARQSEEARQRERRFRGESAPPPRIEDRTVIVVDDGLATGATMRAAVRSIAKRHPARLIVAVPVGSRQACEALQHEADEVICLMTPDPFWAVGLYYEDFAPVEDDQVQEILARARVTSAPAASSSSHQGPIGAPP